MTKTFREALDDLINEYIQFGAILDDIIDDLNDKADDLNEDVE